MEPGQSSIIYRRRCSAIHRSSLAQFANQLSKDLADGQSFECLISDDEELQSLNRKFRKKNKPTDVLSFPDGSGFFLGSLAISYDRAKDQAREYGHRIEEEIRILILHGVLHLSGMDHEADQGEMGRKEAVLRKKYGLPPGLIARAEA